MSEIRSKAKVARVLFPIVLAVLYALMTYAISYKLLINVDSDLHAHMLTVTESWRNNGFLYFFSNISYPGWHAMVMLLVNLNVPEMIAASITCSVFSSITVVVVWYATNYILGKSSSIWLIIGATIVIIMVTAIYVPWYNPHIYYGQGSPTVWHNPTYNAVKPFALLSCILLFKIIERRDANLRACLLYTLISLLCMVMKPSFIQIQAPGVFLYLVLDYILNRDLKFDLKVACTFIPSFVYMALQAWIMFYVSRGSGGIALAPFAAMSLSAPNVIVSSLLLLAFPLYSVIVLRKDIFNSRSAFLFVFFMFIVGFVEYALFTELGDRAAHGNFAWGYQIAVFLVWAFYLPLFVKKAFIEKSLSKPLIVIGCILVLLHFVSGCWYYRHFFVIPGKVF